MNAISSSRKQEFYREHLLRTFCLYVYMCFIKMNCSYFICLGICLLLTEQKTRLHCYSFCNKIKEENTVAINSFQNSF